MASTRKIFVPATLAGSASAFAIAASLFSAVPAAAQVGMQQVAQADGGLEEIVVTARRKAESAQSTPVSVTAISGEQLETLNIQQIEGLSKIAPSLRITQASGSGNSPAMFIRGIGTISTALYVEPAVGLYIDGLYTPRPSGNTFDLPDISGVEVLRGPQGTLFGRNTTGGAVLLSTYAPSAEPSVKVKGQVASRSDLSASAVVQLGQIADSPFAVKVSAQTHARDGWVETPGANKSEWGGALSSQGVGVAIRGELFDALTIDNRARYNRVVSYTGWEVLGGTAAGLAYFTGSSAVNGPAFPVGVGPRDLTRRDPRTDGRSEVKTFNDALTLEYAVNNDLTLKSISGYSRIKQNLRANLGGGYTLGTVANPAVAGQPIEPVSVHTTTGNPGLQRQITQELQLLGDIGDFNYIVGFYYYDERVQETITTILNSPLSATQAIRLDRSTDYNLNSQSYAGFGQVSYKPSALDKRLELSAGIRYTKDKKQLDSRQISRTVTTSTIFQSARDSWDNIGWSASASYAVADDVLGYFRAASAYRSGGYNAPSVGLPPFGPEKAVSYEAGVKSELLDRHLRVNAAIYQTDYDDLQVNQFNTVTRTNVLTNAGKARFRGAEFETAAVFGAFQVDGSIGYVKPKFREYNFVTNGVLTNVASRAKFALVPKWTYHVGAQYAVDTANTGTVTVRADYSGKSNASSYTVLESAPSMSVQVPTVGREHNLSLRVMWEQEIGGRTYKAQVFGENLTDNRYLTFATDFGALVTGTYNRPRWWGVSVGADF